MPMLLIPVLHLLSITRQPQSSRRRPRRRRRRHTRRSPSIMPPSTRATHRSPQRPSITRPSKTRNRALPRAFRILRLDHPAHHTPSPNPTTHHNTTRRRHHRRLPIRLVKPASPPTKIHQRSPQNQHRRPANRNPRNRARPQPTTIPSTTTSSSRSTRTRRSRARRRRRTRPRGRGRRRSGSRPLGGKPIARRELVGRVHGVRELRVKGLRGVGVDDADHVVGHARVRGGAVEEEGGRVVYQDGPGGGLVLVRRVSWDGMAGRETKERGGREGLRRR